MTQPQGGGVFQAQTDALNRLTQVSYPDTRLNVSYQYDQGLNGIGRLTGMTDANGATRYTYNAFGQPLSKTRISSDNITTAFSYAYDSNGRLLSQTYPSGRVVHYGYDPHSQLISLSLTKRDGATQTLVQNIQQLPFGPIEAFDYGNGLSLSRTFDLNYRLIDQTVTGILESSYQHDPVGNITHWQDLLDTGRDQQFGYDQLDRLTSASGAYGSLSYSYDATGNRLSLSDNSATETYSYVPNSHRLQQIISSVTDDRTYDAAVNTIQSLIGSYTYDETNRMVSFSKLGATASYAYNGSGERIQKSVNGTLTRYRYGDNAQLLGEYDQSGEAIREYVYLGGQPVAQVDHDPISQIEEIHYLHTDHLGAVIKATDSAQSLVWDAERRPFGKRTITTAQIEMPLGFPGQYFDEESGTYYNYFRDYDPATGRYLQSDPIGLLGGINTYAYAYLNPLSFTDELGLFGDGQSYGPDADPNGPRGHSDFPGSDRFDYTKEDHGWTNPFLQPWNHFRPQDDVEKDLADAISKCDKEKFERLMHQGQDYYPHYRPGLRWFPFGHVPMGTIPDKDPASWMMAYDWTKIWIDKWDKSCNCP